MNLLILSLSHFLHLLATVVWIGGIVMILFVILPVARGALESAPMVGKLMKEITKRFTPMANVSILVLIVTGIFILQHEENFTGFSDLKNLWNIILFLKHFLVAVMILIHFYRGLILTPKIGRLSVQTNELPEPSSLSSKIARLQRFSLNLVKINLALGLIVLLLTGISSSL
ncbi:MAG: DUF4149 domain-containing protein [Desulfobacterales bacterium]|nr:DUF4149 domain-containing protein [Desulfobacterales bacterium]